MKQKFEEMLRSTGRPEVEKILSNLTALGFFDAPASTRYHLSQKGGLVEHCVNVCNVALMLREQMIKAEPALEKKLPLQSVVFVALLHDVCKAEIYKEGFRNVKNSEGVWEKVPTFDVDYTHFPAGHGEKSVIRLLMWGVKLTPDEVLAIRWHMAAWDLPFQSYEEMGNLNAARDKCPMMVILQAADMLASGIVEADYLKN